MLYWIGENERHEVSGQPEEDDLDEHEEKRLDNPSAHNSSNSNYRESASNLPESTRRLQASVRQGLGITVSRKRMTDLTNPLEAGLANKRAQRVGEERSLSFPDNGHHLSQGRRVVATSRSPSVESADLSGLGRDGQHYSTSIRNRSRGDSRSYGQHCNDFDDTKAQEYGYSRTAPPLSSSSRNERSHFMNSKMGQVEYQTSWTRRRVWRV